MLGEGINSVCPSGMRISLISFWFTQDQGTATGPARAFDRIITLSNEHGGSAEARSAAADEKTAAARRWEPSSALWAVGDRTRSPSSPISVSTCAFQPSSHRPDLDHDYSLRTPYQHHLESTVNPYQCPHHNVSALFHHHHHPCLLPQTTVSGQQMTAFDDE